jgi:hypothetical protein
VAALAVLGAAAAGSGSQGLGAEQPYVVGSEQDPTRGKGPEGPHYASFTLIREQRYAERFAVERVAVAPDGRELAAVTRASRQGPRAWDFATGRPVELPPVPSSASALAYSRDMRSVAVALEADTIEGTRAGIAVYDLENGKQYGDLQGADGVRALSFSPDGGVLLGAAAEGLVGWDLGSGARSLVLSLPGGADTVSFSSASEVYVAADGGGVVMRVSLRDGAVLESWEGKPGQRALAFSPEGRLLAVGREDGFAVLDLWDGGGKAQRVACSEAVTALGWSASGTVLAAGTSGGLVLAYGVEGVRGVSAGGERTTLPRSGRGAATEEDGALRARPSRAAGAESAGGARAGAEAPLGLDYGRGDSGGGGAGDTSEVGDGGDARRDDPALLGEVEERAEVVATFHVLVLDQLGGDPRSGGALETALRKNVGRLEGCWKKEARKGNKATGELRMGMSVTPDGEGRAVADPDLDTVQNPKLLECVKQHLALPLFAPGLGTMEIELRMVLEEEKQ